jgi:hypothetical protein
MRKPPSNTRAIGRALRSLREDGRLDDLDEALAVLAVCSAVLVDEALGPRSDMAGYARAKVLQVHAGLLRQLRERLPEPAENDAFAAFLESLSHPTRADERFDWGNDQPPSGNGSDAIAR